jgi:hypothetical protein
MERPLTHIAFRSFIGLILSSLCALLLAQLIDPFFSDTLVQLCDNVVGFSTFGRRYITFSIRVGNIALPVGLSDGGLGGSSHLLFIFVEF